MNPAPISIRTARQNDYVALWQIAALDSALVPEAPLLVAELDGEIVAALSLATEKAIADPFRRTGGAVDLLRLRASQLPREAARGRGGLRRRPRGRPEPARLSDAALAQQP